MNEPVLSIIRTFEGTLLLLAVLIPFLWIREQLSKKLLSLLYRITRDARRAHQIHFIFVFPGVLIHELSHYLMLRLLSVPCTLHVGVEMQDDFVIYGHVDYYENHITPVKQFLSGIAPLISGIVLVSLLAVQWMGIPPIHALANQQEVIEAASILAAAKGFLFWFAFYLIFAITSEIVPSSADRKYWYPFIFILLALLLLSYLTQTLGWFLNTAYPYLDNWFKVISFVFLIGLAAQVLLLLPVSLLGLLRRKR